MDTILFDLDGTLLDTNPLILASFRHTLGYYFPNETYQDEDIFPFIGPTLEKSFKALNEPEWKEMQAFYRSFNIAMHDALVAEYPGVIEGLHRLHTKGYKMGIVTSKGRPVVEHGLRLFNIDHLFGVVVTADDVENEKPHAEPVEQALRALGSTPERAVMVGDNDTDIFSGKNAGTKTVAVGWALKGRAFLETLEPDVIIESMEHFETWLDEVTVNA
ncbi:MULTISPECIES: pyrophosphatase PpaX [unclassified Exiguobacterium]|uniref:pyrophosphatase PpaX n=1 Tax=unclassified Exiguobacterium TaxID=2644629 RepID=UPI00103FB160|nr:MULTISPECIES: pyrophosphatase PpaX [unclassified Exiguobacterium]TCI39317.1 pyrophosphatase PpaX [Exiguobacterium sp. SH4S7]TCI47988.1 pyrophosphatase PpaX [Exiguobacterium sp. SH5S32]TCI54870.1 pyrophosphatase PpaX [Exiguobacterium sp. SH1S4]TCI74667.1 pyrophosphatase PpaX [Exiguobacterium sp. SH1S1]